nr:unnamed protein product [Digitaria exilis]
MGGTRLSNGELRWWMLLVLFICCRLSSPSSANAAEERVVTHLPASRDPSPSTSEQGRYVEVDESNGVRLFYYFTPSEHSPADDPLMIWLSGGPGCTSFAGLVYQIGPLKFDSQGYKNGLPKLVYQSESWTKWFEVHPEFLSNPLYIGGDSYSGINVVSEPALNLKGYLVGNPFTDVNFDKPSKIPFAHRVGLISDQFYEVRAGKQMNSTLQYC